MNEQLLKIYSKDYPPFFEPIVQSPLLQRIAGIGMNCGCEYTSFPFFRSLAPYSRLEHSIGVGLIVWNFTHSKAQAIAGLLHDVASPSFAHVIDFMKGDYITQESTEERTYSMIQSSVQVCRVLSELGMSVEQVSDYHLYPIADNDTPKLSADRLEYTLGNIINFRLGGVEDVREIYSSLSVTVNEEGEEELCFTDRAVAEKFARYALECGKVYVSPADRYSMQLLSEIVKRAAGRGTVTEDMLYTTEKQVIEALCSDSEGGMDWKWFTSLNGLYEVEASGRVIAKRADVLTREVVSGLAVNDSSEAWRPEYPVRVISAKKRRIDPLVAGEGRVSALSTSFAAALNDFMRESFNERLKGFSTLGV